MALILNGTTGITVTDGSNILQDGTVQTADLANAAVTSAKMATGAAATNLGNYVQSFNGSTGAVTGVASFNGSTGAVTYTAPVTSVNGNTGAITVQATLVSGTNIKSINGTSLLGSGDITVGASTSYNAVGTYIFFVIYTNQLDSGTTVSAGNSQGQIQAAIVDDGGYDSALRTSGISNNLSGTWRVMTALRTNEGIARFRFGIAVRVS